MNELSEELQPLFEFVEVTFDGDQLFVGSLFDDRSLFKDHNHVRVFDGVDSVGDVDARPLFHDPIQRFLDPLLVFAIEGRGRLVE